jgi:hypothetical protein
MKGRSGPANGSTLARRVCAGDEAHHAPFLPLPVTLLSAPFHACERVL